MKLVRLVIVGLLTACSSTSSTEQPSGETDAALDSALDSTSTPDTLAETASEVSIDAAPEIKFDTTNKTVFVTSVTYTGDLGGVAGADAKCQALADAAKLTGTFKAWLSSATSAPATTFTRTSGDYVLVDGTTVVAHGWDGLTSGTLLHAIDQTESKMAPPVTAPPCGVAGGGTAVWTGSKADGTAATGLGTAPTCTDWTTAAPSAGSAVGSSAATTTWWSLRCSGSGGCDTEAALYCFAQ